jgi:hypothetical protein
MEQNQRTRAQHRLDLAGLFLVILAISLSFAVIGSQAILYLIGG